MTSAPIRKPIPGEMVRREVGPNYTLCEEAPSGFNTVGLTWLETGCVGTCKRPYLIDPNHPEYKAVKAALDSGDRSVIHCYHRDRGGN